MAGCLMKLRALARLNRVSGRALSTAGKNPQQAPQEDDTTHDDKFVRGPVSFASSHWLDRWSPGAREWLEGQNRRWWIEGVKGRCKKHIELRGSEKEISKFVEDAYKHYLEIHESKITDGRSQTHVQTACLVLATFKVFKSYIRDDEELLKIVREHMGGMTAPLIRAMLHSSLFIRKVIFRIDVFSAVARMMKSLEIDMGSSFKCDFRSSKDEASLEVHSCLYHDVFLEEGVPQLTSCCCCSLDALWFDHLEFHKVGYIREDWLADGDSKCAMCLKRLK
ncbi:hypothetical protein BSKO_04105 [Bryopsis sp. KO-2023]|nr:hypothetical protein BSKO_04105 [Bryopsis sp. KO-2023]